VQSTNQVDSEHEKQLTAMRLVPSTEPESDDADADDEDENEENEKEASSEQVHAPTKTVNFIDVDADPDAGNDDGADDDDDDGVQTTSPVQHKTGLTQHIDKILIARPRPDSPAEIVPDQSPEIAIENDDDASFEENIEFDPTANNTASNRGGSGQPSPIVQTTTTRLSLEDRGSLRRNGSVFGVSELGRSTSHHRGRESALRDSLHITKFLHRKSSFAPGLGMPEFERKIYLDFNLFDESGLHSSGHSSLALPDQKSIFSDADPPAADFEFPATQSAPNNTMSKHRLARKPTHYKKMMRTPRNFAATSYASDDSGSDTEEENKYDNDDDGLDAHTPRTPAVHAAHVSLNDSAGIDGGEGTFLGSCHISINIDDSEELAKYHNEVREKIVKIGRGKDEGKKSKLKFKVYCNALSAYLKHGKNYGDRIAEEMHTMEVLSDKNRNSPHGK